MFKQRLFRLLSIVLCLAMVDSGMFVKDMNVAEASSFKTLFAAPSGEGSICSLESPCSLETVRDIARTLVGSMAGDIDIVLRGGTYELASTFTLTGEDSGRNGYRVNYKSYSGEKPVISGGKQVTGWQLYDQATGDYTALL